MAPAEVQTSLTDVMRQSIAQVMVKSDVELPEQSSLTVVKAPSFEECASVSSTCVVRSSSRASSAAMRAAVSATNVVSSRRESVMSPVAI